MVLNGVSYAQTRAARSRAEAEIHAIAIGLENYKIDTGAYPSGLDTSSTPSGVSPSENAGRVLAAHLCGVGAVAAADQSPTDIHYKALKKWKGYLTLPQSSFSMTGATISLPNPNSAGDPDPIVIKVMHLIDPFGSAYGYSVGGAFNPTFDLWSTTGSADQAKWITNW